MFGKLVRWLRMPGVLLVILSLVVPVVAGAGRSSARPYQGVGALDRGTARIHLKVGSFDPLEEPAPSGYQVAEMFVPGVRSDPEYYIVQFDSPITPADKEALAGRGVELYDYIPDFAFVVRMSDAARSLVEQLPQVRWVGYYQAGFRVAPSLFGLDQPASTEQEFTVLTFPGAMDRVVEDISALGGAVLEQSETTRRGKLRVRVEIGQVGRMAALPGVRWIEAAPQWELANNEAVDLMNARDVWDTQGLYGAGQTVAVCDTGLDRGSTLPGALHDDFEDGNGSSRVVALVDMVGGGDGADDVRSGHGTHVAGSVLGNGDLSGASPGSRLFPNSAYVGVAPEANLVFQAVEDNDTGQLTGIPDDLTALFAAAQTRGAQIHTNSWGDPRIAYAGVYDSQAEDVDAYIWSHPDFTILFAAGNQGTDESNRNGVVDPDSIGSPGTAKNCITVGASENNRPTIFSTYGGSWPSDYPVDPIRTDRMTNNPSGMAAFSSRGPTDDGRYKPDLVAPGTFIASTRSSGIQGFGWGYIDPNYMYMGGTSMATPLVAGAAALVRQFYVERGGITPSSALIKATLINGASSLSPGQYGTGSFREIPDPPRPNNVEGWGRVNVAESIFPASPRVLHYTDYVTGLMTSEVATFQYRVVNSAEPLRVTLVWNDYPGTPAANPTLVNNLDLTVSGPSAVMFYPSGAQQLEGSWSASATADNVNNIEGIDVLTPAAGVYTINVRGANIPQGPQPFALAVSGAVIVPGEALQVTSIQPISAPNNGTLTGAVVSGKGFEAGMQVHLLSGNEVITATNGVVDASADTITADLALNNATPGWWDVRVASSPAFSATLESAFFVIDATLPNLRVVMQPDQGAIDPGALLTYTIDIHNAGFVTATGVVFTNTLAEELVLLDIDPACAGGTLVLPGGAFACRPQSGSLPAASSVSYTVTVSVSAEAMGFLSGRVSVASQERDGYLFDNDDQFSVQAGPIRLPVIMRNWTLLPGTPVLDSISNSDLEGNYNVIWNPSMRAETYLLQEDDHAAFSSPASLYSGIGTSWTAVNKPSGIYYYRVRANNAWGASPWSNVESAITTMVTPGFWMGGAVDFFVTPDGSYVDDFAVLIDVEGCARYKVTHPAPEQITNRQFSFSGAFYGSGNFNSLTTASGSEGLDRLFIDGCGTVSGGPWTFNASWRNSSQPTFQPVELVEPYDEQAIMETNGSYIVTPVR